MSNCKAEGCDKPRKYANGLCGMHWVRAYRSGEKQSTVRAYGTGSIYDTGYVVVTQDGRRVGEHVLVAERALGKRLPKGAIVHHLDENPLNNSPGNLVICPDQKYHSLLHQRADAIRAGKPAHWRKCWVCKEYDDPTALYIGRYAAHRNCVKSYGLAYRTARKEEHESS